MTTHATSSPRRDGGSLHPNTSTVDQILSISWDRQLAKDLAAEIEACTGERRDTVEEMRRFLALKGYRELLQRLRSAREGKTSEEALKAVAHAFRSYALERPALSAAAFRTAAPGPQPMSTTTSPAARPLNWMASAAWSPRPPIMLSAATAPISPENGAWWAW